MGDLDLRWEIGMFLTLLLLLAVARIFHSEPQVLPLIKWYVLFIYLTVLGRFCITFSFKILKRFTTFNDLAPNC